MAELSKVSSFIRSFLSDDEGRLGELYMKAVQDQVPVIRPETKELLKTQLLLLKPHNILEIGTAVGYSSLYMTQFIPEDAKITSLELDSERVRIARSNIEEFGKSKQIAVIEGDAAQSLKELKDEDYDFVFVDAAKGQYIFYLPDVLRVTKHGGLILSDNILQEGEILESHFTVEKRNRTIHDRMRDYIYAITHHEELDTAVLSVADGVAISIKK